MVSVWNKVEWVKEIIASSSTRMEVLERLDRSTTSAMYRRLKQFEIDHGVDISLYRPFSSHKRNLAATNNRSLANNEIFRQSSTTAQSVVRRRVIRDRLVGYVCGECGCGDTWNGKPIALQLDHVDGSSTNNELSNLRFLCPNCHSQTDTYCGKNVEYKKETTNKKDYISAVREEATQRNQHLVDKVLQSGIDFSKYGWSKQVAQILEKNPQKVKEWMMRYMKEFYETVCYHRQERQ